MERRPIAILKFMVSLEPLSNSSEKLYFLAERRVHHWFSCSHTRLSDMAGSLRMSSVPEAPNGTSELLIHEAMSFVGRVATSS